MVCCQIINMLIPKVRSDALTTTRNKKVCLDVVFHYKFTGYLCVYFCTKSTNVNHGFNTYVIGIIHNEFTIALFSITILKTTSPDYN